MGRIVQFGVGVDEDVMVRLERLRACLGQARSRVVELALVSGGLDAIEADHVREIKRFAALATSAGVTWQEYARAYAVQFARQTYPPTIDDLERIANIVDAGKIIGEALSNTAQ